MEPVLEPQENYRLKIQLKHMVRDKGFDAELLSVLYSNWVIRVLMVHHIRYECKEVIQCRLNTQRNL